MQGREFASAAAYRSPTCGSAVAAARRTCRPDDAALEPASPDQQLRRRSRPRNRALRMHVGKGAPKCRRQCANRCFRVPCCGGQPGRGCRPTSTPPRYSSGVVSMRVPRASAIGCASITGRNGAGSFGARVLLATALKPGEQRAGKAATSPCHNLLDLGRSSLPPMIGERLLGQSRRDADAKAARHQLDQPPAPGRIELVEPARSISLGPSEAGSAAGAFRQSSRQRAVRLYRHRPARPSRIRWRREDQLELAAFNHVRATIRRRWPRRSFGHDQ